jgi:L-threonylcarbamoyladenylate synthase
MQDIDTVFWRYRCIGMVDMTMSWRIRQAVKSIKKGEVIAYPTEAVYGLGCDPWDEVAVLRLLDIKQRPWEKGLILIAADFNQLQAFIEPVSADVLQRLTASWPGPNTWVLPARPDVPAVVTGAHNSIAVRVTAHKQTAALCRSFGGAIVSTSANRAGKKPAQTLHDVRWQLPEVDYVMAGLCAGSDKPSTIRDGLTGERLR